MEGPSQIVWLVKAFVAISGDPSLIPGTQMVEGENGLLDVVL